MFQPLLDCLGPGVATRIVRYPERVHLTYKQLEELVVCELPTGAPYVLIAESFSGPIALQIAARGGGNLRAVVLVSSFAYRPLGRSGVLIARLPFACMFRLRPPVLALRTMLLGAGASADLIETSRKTIGRVGRRVLEGRLREALNSRYCVAAINSDVRVVAFRSARDRLLGGRAVDSILRVCPRAEIREIDAPHCALQSAPQSVIRALRECGILV